MSNIRRKNPPKRHYDVEMVRDFLDHLRWEYAISHLENTNPGCPVNPELSEQLQKYMQKWDTAGLKPATRIEYGDASPEEIQQAGGLYSEITAAHAQIVLDALDNLKEALETAFNAASPEWRDKFPIQVFTVQEILEWGEHDEEEDAEQE